MIKKFRLCPKDDYSTSEGIPLANALERELNNGALRAAVKVIFCHLAETDALSCEEVLSVLNVGRYGPLSDDEWEIVP